MMCLLRNALQTEQQGILGPHNTTGCSAIVLTMLEATRTRRTLTSTKVGHRCGENMFAFLQIPLFGVLGSEF